MRTSNRICSAIIICLCIGVHLTSAFSMYDDEIETRMNEKRKKMRRPWQFPTAVEARRATKHPMPNNFPFTRLHSWATKVLRSPLETAIRNGDTQFYVRYTADNDDITHNRRLYLSDKGYDIKNYVCLFENNLVSMVNHKVCELDIEF